MFGNCTCNDFRCNCNLIAAKQWKADPLSSRRSTDSLMQYVGEEGAFRLRASTAPKYRETQAFLD
eukprot:5965706-Amphidinium_carterae.1